MKAVISDMDGVAIDSEPLWNQADHHFTRKYGLDASYDSVTAILAGKRMSESAAILKKMYGISETVKR